MTRVFVDQPRVEGEAPGLVAGVGVRACATADDLVAAILGALEAVGEDRVAVVATWSRHAEHPAVTGAARRLGARVETVAVDDLTAADAPTPSARVARLTGATPSVAEAAVLARGARLVVPKTTGRDCTVALGVLHEDPLRHHGDAEATAGLVDFAVNVAVLRPPEFVRAAMAEALERVAAYPDEAPVRAHVAAALGVDPEALLLTNGAAEAFGLVAGLRDWSHPLVVQPQFTEPEAALVAAGRGPVRRRVLSADDGFRLDPATVDPAADLVIVGNPTNPTSRLHARADLARLARPGRVLVVDEAFLDIADDPGQSLLAAAARSGEGGDVLVLRSLTKTFGLAGVRAGYVVGPPALVARLRARQAPWSVNSLALAALRAAHAPEGEAHVEGVQAATRAHRAHLVAALEGAGLRVVADPAGPFVLASHPDAAALRLALREAGFAVRRGDTFPGLDATWLRFAVRPPEVADALAAAITERATRLHRRRQEALP